MQEIDIKQLCRYFNREDITVRKAIANILVNL